MAHHLLLKFPFTHRSSTHLTSPGKSSSTAEVPSSLDSATFLSTTSSPSQIIKPRHSTPSMPYATLPPRDASPASGKSRRPVNLFKRLLGKEHPFSNLAAQRIRPDKTVKELRLGLYARTAPEDGDSLETPISSHKLHWDCANTV
jgi:hypothetical protein